MSDGERLLFGPYEFNRRTGRLLKLGYRVKLQPRPAALLSALLENPGTLVSREVLRNRLWPEGTYVDFDLGLNVAVNRLREALSDVREDPKYIQTVHGEGYRFIGSVNVVPASAAPDTREPVPVAPEETPDEDSTGPATAVKEDVPPVPTPHVAQPRRTIPWSAHLAIILLLALAGSTAWIWRHKFAEQNRPIALQLTFNTTDLPVSSFALSPDGKLLAYADPSGVYLKEVSTGNTHVITLPSEVAFSSMAWAPDSINLYFAGPKGVWRMPMFGPPAQRISEMPANFPAVSPDGRSLLVRRNTGLWIISTGDGTARQVLSAQGLYSFGRGVWSPDGNSIAYLKWEKIGKPLLETRNLQSGETHIIVSSLTRAMLPCCWTPDQRIIFSCGEAPPNNRWLNLWQVHVAANGSASDEPTQLTHWPDVSFEGFSASATADAISFLNRHRTFSVYVADLNTDAVRLDNLRRITLKMKDGWPSDWSEDGKSLVFSASGPHGGFAIYRQEVSGPNAEPVMVAPGEEVSAAHYTADHQSLLFLRERGSRATLMRMPAAGGEATELFPVSAQTETDQCPSLPGPCVVSDIVNGSFMFSSFDPQVGRRTALPIPGIDENAQWSLSRDGTKIAVMSGLGPTNRVTVYSLKGTLVTSYELPENLISAQPRWTGEGGVLVTGSPAQSGTSAVPGGKVFWIHNGVVATLWSSNSEVLRSPVVSPDGKRVAFYSGKAESNVWLLPQP